MLRYQTLRNSLSRRKFRRTFEQRQAAIETLAARESQLDLAKASLAGEFSSFQLTVQAAADEPVALHTRWIVEALRRARSRNVRRAMRRSTRAAARMNKLDVRAAILLQEAQLDVAAVSASYDLLDIPVVKHLVNSAEFEEALMSTVSLGVRVGRGPDQPDASPITSRYKNDELIDLVERAEHVWLEEAITGTHGSVGSADLRPVDDDEFVETWQSSAMTPTVLSALVEHASALKEADEDATSLAKQDATPIAVDDVARTEAAALAAIEAARAEAAAVADLHAQVQSWPLWRHALAEFFGRHPLGT